MKHLLGLFLALLVGLATFTSCDRIGKQLGFNEYEWGDRVDSLHGVYVYYNGSVGNVKGRNLAHCIYEMTFEGFYEEDIQH